MYVTERRTMYIMDALQNKYDADWCRSYGEPGYRDPAKWVVFANWNKVSQRTQQYLEEAGCILEWSDEWMIDYETSKAYRTDGNGYNWVCSVAWDDENFRWLTPDSDLDDWIWLVRHTKDKASKKAIPTWVTEAMLLNAGFTHDATEYEAGLHPGQNADPRRIAEGLLTDEVSEVVFRIDSVGMFDVGFSAYYR